MAIGTLVNQEKKKNMANVKELKIFGYDITLVWKYRYAKIYKNEKIKSLSEWNKWEIGFFFKKNKIVSKKNFKQPKEWGNNLVNSYMIGINLLIWKAWFTISKNVMKIKIKDN